MCLVFGSVPRVRLCLRVDGWSGALGHGPSTLALLVLLMATCTKSLTVARMASKVALVMFMVIVVAVVAVMAMATLTVAVVA